jgi:patatin-like phospholipase/acyl hydrolase
MAPPFKVLSVDGGGMRGLIPALVLASIEERTGRPISDIFDLLAGTSTGAIIVLGLTKPSTDGKVEKSARDVVTLYETKGATIFPRSLLQALHVGAIRGAKYDAKGLDATLARYFGDTRLKDALKPVVVPSYDIEKQVPIFFKSKRAKDNPDYDFPMREVARATAAAPTYFPPQKIQTADPLQYNALLDGGVIAGNPAMCAYAEALKMDNIADNGVLMLSLGTGVLRHSLKYDDACDWGQLEWAQPIIDIALNGSNATVDYQLQQLLRAGGPQQSYYRLQVELNAELAAMDDARDDTIKRLMDLAEDYLRRPTTLACLDQLCAQLTA